MVLQVNIETQADPLLANLPSPASTPLSSSAPINLFEVKIDNGSKFKRASARKNATIHEDFEDDESCRSSHSSPPQYFELTAAQIAAGRRKAYRRDDCMSYRAAINSTIAHEQFGIKSRMYWMSDAVDSLTMVLSALYAKLLVIIGLCFPMAEVISHRIPIGWYEGFYLYLYLGSIVFLFLIYVCREGKKSKRPCQSPSCLNPLKAIFCWVNEKSSSRSESPERGAKPRFQVI